MKRKEIHLILIHFINMTVCKIPETPVTRVSLIFTLMRGIEELKRFGRRLEREIVFVKALKRKGINERNKQEE